MNSETSALIQGPKMTYTVIIFQDDGIARLVCASLNEAHEVRRSFINYGKCQDVRIEISNISGDL